MEEVTQYRVIERGRTTGYIYQVTNPLAFNLAESFAYKLREISKQGGHEVTCWLVVPNSSELLDLAR